MRQPLTREAIAATARDILVEEGLHAVSLRRVAARLGVTAPALYAHVDDKRDLLQGIVSREVDLLLTRFDAVGEPGDKLQSMALAYIDFACENPDLFRAMFLFRPELTADPRGDEPALGTAIQRAFEAAARDAQRAGTLDGDDATMAGLCVWTAAHGVATTLLSGPPIDLAVKGRLAEAAVGAVLTGLGRGSLVDV